MNRFGTGCRIFIDLQNWTVGIEVRRRKSKEDPLGQYRCVMVCLGPLIMAVRWRVAP